MKQESERVTENIIRWLYNRPRDRDRKCVGARKVSREKEDLMNRLMSCPYTKL